MPVKIFLIDPKVNKKSSKFPLHIHKKINVAFEILKQSPLSGVKLHGELSDFYKFRIGDYRIVYRFVKKDNTIEIVKVEHRQGVYK